MARLDDLAVRNGDLYAGAGPAASVTEVQPDTDVVLPPDLFADKVREISDVCQGIINNKLRFVDERKEVSEASRKVVYDQAQALAKACGDYSEPTAIAENMRQNKLRAAVSKAKAVLDDLADSPTPLHSAVQVPLNRLRNAIDNIVNFRQPLPAIAENTSPVPKAVTAL